MKNLLKIAKGFTLLELLVVVLIIGILAAIALPQYEMSVEKAKAAEALTNMKAITDAVERNILTMGTTANDAFCQHENLDIELSGGNWHGNFYVTNNFIYEICGDVTGIIVDRCTNCQQQVSENDWSNANIIYELFKCYPSSANEDCFVCSTESDKGKKICKALEGLGVENLS